MNITFSEDTTQRLNHIAYALGIRTETIVKAVFDGEAIEGFLDPAEVLNAFNGSDHELGCLVTLLNDFRSLTCEERQSFFAAAEACGEIPYQYAMQCISIHANKTTTESKPGGVFERDFFRKLTLPKLN